MTFDICVFRCYYFTFWVVAIVLFCYSQSAGHVLKTTCWSSKRASEWGTRGNWTVSDVVTCWGPNGQRKTTGSEMTTDYSQDMQSSISEHATPPIWWQHLSFTLHLYMFVTLVKESSFFWGGKSLLSHSQFHLHTHSCGIGNLSPCCFL